MASAVSDRLREATAVIHQRLEACIPLTAISTQPTAYRQLLQAYWGFYAPFEAALQPHVESFGDLQWQRRIKHTLLAADLAGLGVTATDLAGLPQCQNLPAVTDVPIALGTMYVLEGATLGGRQILGMQSDRLAARGASRFLTGYGTATGRMWRQFLNCLERCAPRDEQQDAVDAAVATFLAFETWLGEQGVLS
ncbi:MAG: biliverdin-producing heme oxygenase [Spongiibacteraceae bacterium]|jgi:heme oxygenase|nr:biliverdin-producing heme oxygenase [Spongiibacteraceae bacterium]